MFRAELPEAESDEVIGEIDDELDDDLPRIEFPDDDESDDIVDVEIVADTGYTDSDSDVDVEIMSDEPGVMYPDESGSSASRLLSGPPSGLMTLEQANEVAATMRARANTRSARRR